jgi:hypothetical protein
MDRHPLSLLALAIVAGLAGADAARAQVIATDSNVIVADAGSGHAHAYAFATTPELLGNTDWSRFMLMEMGDHGKVVKDAPYSAEAISETSQVLADGNRIAKRNVTLLYRDAAGRTRQEQTAPGNLVFINDPVSGRKIVLNAEKKTATVMPSIGAYGAAIDVDKLKALGRSGDIEKLREIAKSGRAHVIHRNVDASEGVDQVIQKSGDGETIQIINEPGKQIVIKRREVEKDGRKNVEESKEVRVSVIRAQGGDDAVAIAGLPLDLDTVLSMRTGRQKGVTTSLGAKDMGGVRAEGTQTIATIAAGEIGNERPIQIISEKWFSPDLQAVVYSRQSDPRRGETIYRLNNIRRVPQSPDLFAIPAGYVIKEPRSAPLPPLPPLPPAPPGSAIPPPPPAPALPK